MRRPFPLATAAVTAVLLAGCTGVGDAPEPTRLTAAPSTAPTPTTTPTFSAADAQFVELMVPHHRQGLALASLVPERTDTPEVVILAQDITALRTPELQQLLEQLQEWRLPAELPAADTSSPTTDGADPSSAPDVAAAGDVEGGLTTEQVQALLDAEGPEFDLLWLEGMVEHHEGGIALAESVLAAGIHRPTLTFAEVLIATNRAQLSRMQAMRGG